MEYILSTRKFRESLKEGKFLGLKCKQCGAYTAPPRKVCLECDSEDMEVVELSGNGKVKTFTVIYVPVKGYQAPYIVALVELEEGPWITVNIVNVDPDKATMDLIGRKGKVGYKEIPADEFSAGERMALTFELVDGA